MQLRSGSVVASGYASAEAARAACMGQASVELPEAVRPAFAGAVRSVLRRWTALRLAVENEWGGEATGTLAAELEEAVLGWFFAKGEHYPDELEEHLDEFLMEEFHVECEDGSPREVATLLVHVFEQCARGDCAMALELAAAAERAAPLSACQRVEEDRRWTLPPGGDGAGAAAAAGRPLQAVSEDDLAAAMAGATTRDARGAAPEEPPLEDGWERVPTRKGGRRGGGHRGAAAAVADTDAAMEEGG